MYLSVICAWSEKEIEDENKTIKKCNMKDQSNDKALFNKYSTVFFYTFKNIPYYKNKISIACHFK